MVNYQAMLLPTSSPGVSGRGHSPWDSPDDPVSPAGGPVPGLSKGQSPQSGESAFLLRKATLVSEILLRF